MTWHGETVVDIPPGSAADGPVYDRPVPAGRGPGRAGRPTTPPRCRGPRTATALRAALLALIGSPGLADKSWVTDQYDRYVRGDTVLAMPEDGGLLRVDEETGLGIALATDGNGRYCRLDPYLGTQLVLSEAYRNVAVTGARPLAVTNCLNFGSPEDPAVMWQFAEAVRGLADGCAALGVPVTGGNVSFYNQTGHLGRAPHPGGRGARRARRRTPAGRDRVRVRRRCGRGGAGQHRAARRDRGRARRVGLGARARTATSAACRRPRAWPPSGGSPACWPRRPRTGCWRPRTTCPTAAWPWRWPNPACAAGPAARCGCPATRSPGCSASRPAAPSSRSGPGAEAQFAALRAAHEVPGEAIGGVGGDELVVEGCFAIPLAELAAVHTATLPALFG